ncbi:MAG TPA: SpoIIE family protein phosphatase [Acidobacteriota bacterium]|nr:SpoIIE family protein phosphatase [Acidobacteriota bacterium]
MATQFDSALRPQLISRRQRLQEALTVSPDHSYLSSLLQEVDSALSRMDDGSYGLCETCHEPIEKERLAADPLLRFCLDHLTAPQQRALEQDLQLAGQIQTALLPRNDLTFNGWRAIYHYQPAGPVSGDYCDLIPAEDGSLFFMLGDVSGKGVAASMLMAHLHAMIRALAGIGLPLEEIVKRTSRLFCENTLADHYATLVCGRADKNGSVQLCNAGHLPSLLAQKRSIRSINSTGLPLGLFCSEEFSIEKITLNAADRLFLFTDGLTESQNPQALELGLAPLIEMMQTSQDQPVHEFMRSCLSHASRFRAGAPPRDDLTMMVIERIV